MREIREVDFSVGLRAGANALAAWQSACHFSLHCPFRFNLELLREIHMNGRMFRHTKFPPESGFPAREESLG